MAEKTEIWDELWENQPKKKDYTYRINTGIGGGELEGVRMHGYLDSELNPWLTKVEAEGDRLQEEGLEHHAIAVAYYEKLEAITRWFNDWINPWLDKAGEKGFMLPKKHMTSLKKILEGEV